MSNVSDAIEHLEDAKEIIDTEAEIDESKEAALLAMADRILQCIYDLRELVEEGD